MLALTEIKSPLNAMILRIHAYPGEKAEKDGLLELGDVEHMQVEAEVYVSDIRQVSLGQKAEIRSEAFEGALSAKVTAIDPLVRPNRFVDLNPQSVRENRVVKVRLALESPATVERLSGAEVSVVINP
jgi:HlyD family secretion protein